MKENRQEINENTFIYCKIIADSDYSTKNTNNRLTGMATE